MTKREEISSAIIRSRYEHLPSLNRTKVDELIQIGKDIHEDVFGQLLDLHIQTSQEIIIGIKSALVEADFNKIAQLAHKFKSNSGQLGLVKLNALCDDLEKLITSEVGSLAEVNILLYFIYSENQITLSKLMIFQGQAA